MAEILVKTLTRHRDSKSALYMTDWTAGDIIEIKPYGYYTGNKWGGAKRMGIVLCVDADLPEEYGKKVHYDPTPIYENGELIDPCDYSKMLGRSELIVDLTKILTDQELRDVFDHDLMVSPKTVKKSYLDLLVERALRTELHAYDRQGSFTTGTIDVGPNGHSDANTWAEAESNIANLTGDLTFNCDEAYQDTTPVTVAGFSLNGHTLTFKCSGSGKHAGYNQGSGTHMCHECNTGSSHCWLLEVPTVLDGLVIKQYAGHDSDEGVRVASGGTGSTIKNCIIYTGLTNADQDCIYCGDWDCVINIENTFLYNARRAGVNMQSYSTSNGRTQVLNAKCVVVVHTGTHDAETEAGFHGRTEAFGDSLTMNLFNCMSFDAVNASCYTQKAEAGSQTWNIDYCIDDDNSIAGVVDNGTGNLASRTLADTDQGSGSYVIVGETANGSQDFRLTDLGNAKNNAQDAHTASTGPNSSLSMPSTDLVGTSRPQNTNYDIGAFEIEAEATVYDETERALTLDAAVGLSDYQTYRETLLAVALAAGIAGSDYQTYQEALAEVIAATITNADIQAYREALAETIAASLAGTDLQSYNQETLAEVIAAGIAGTDYQTYREILAEVIAAGIAGTDIQAYQDALAVVVASQIAGTNIQIYQEALAEVIAATVAGSDVIGFSEQLATVIASQVAGTDIQAYQDALAVAVVSQIAGTNIQTYQEALAEVIAAQVAGSDVIGFTEQLATVIATQVAGTDLQTYRETLSLSVASGVTLTDVQTYLEALGIILGASITVDDEELALPELGLEVPPRLFALSVEGRDLSLTVPVRIFGLEVEKKP